MSDQTSQKIFSNVIEAIATAPMCVMCGGVHQGALLRLIAKMAEEYDFEEVTLSKEGEEVFGAALLQRD